MRTILYTYLLIFCMGSAVSQNSLPFEIERIASFNGPWAMTFLPDGDILVTEKSGRLLMMDHDGSNMIEVTGVPSVAYDGQGGLGDVTLHPDYAKNKMLYLSFAEAEEGDKDKKGAAVIRAKLNIINNTKKNKMFDDMVTTIKNKLSLDKRTTLQIINLLK